MEKIFNNKYLDQKKLVMGEFHNLVSNFSQINQNKINDISLKIVNNAIEHKAASQFANWLAALCSMALFTIFNDISLILF